MQAILTERAGAWPAIPAPVVPHRTLPPQPPLPRIKVLHVVTRFWGGSGLNTLMTALGMDPDRYEVWVAGVPGDELWDRAAAKGVHTVQIPGFRDVLTPADALVLWRLVRLIRRERFTIVHTHNAKGGFLGRLAARLCRTPVVVHTFHAISFHDHMPRWRRALYRSLERVVSRFAHAYLAVAPRLALETVHQRLAPPGSVEVVPSGVDLAAIPEGFDPACRQTLGVPEGITLIGTVGRLVYQKAPLDFVRMAALVHGRYPETAFVIVGDGPLADEVRRLAADLGVDVHITGWRPDAHRLAAGLDVFVMPSLYEGMGRALTEALAAARPVVATAVNGVPDLVEPGATGLLVAPSDPGGLARAVGWLLDHPDEASAMGRQGRVRARAAFSRDAMCAAVDACYRRLLALPGPQSPSGGLSCG
ncbi:glycosyltransferase family 4 protein [Streptomyces afghaniensis]|uniref:glycosyltransferase family 4 protein n=1 Tax=Streptomyces afghaniensis TaxID=66865 RepID=UPI002787497C|nr:glycosyltransferase family 4 protein [Streptomyces afghaniensis]MDQ1014668.1 glycosyltransferase involved in cell wall biosynthesis [Streptomyces afghaniensis]